MDAANTQINAQVQLRTVLENMGAMDSYEALTNEVSGNELENDLTLNTAGALWPHPRRCRRHAGPSQKRTEWCPGRT